MKRRKTSASELIYDIIRKSTHALSHQDIKNKIGNVCDRVTIYRVLDRLVEDGKAHKLTDMDGVFRFASSDEGCESDHEHHHIHFSCDKCKKITCLDDIVPEFKLPRGFVMHKSNFTVAGLCPLCSSKE